MKCFFKIQILNVIFTNVIILDLNYQFLHHPAFFLAKIMNSEFFKNFPSLNSNSKENRRHRQIDREFKEYLKTNKIIHDNSKPPKVKNENYSPSIFDFVEEKNREVNERRLESKRVYQKILQDQINEARQRKEMQKLKEEQEKFLAER